MERLLSHKVKEIQDSIIMQKYSAGWSVQTIAGYIGVSKGLITGRLSRLRRDGFLETRKEKKDGLNGY